MGRHGAFCRINILIDQVINGFEGFSLPNFWKLIILQIQLQFIIEFVGEIIKSETGAFSGLYCTNFSPDPSADPLFHPYTLLTDAFTLRILAQVDK